ncbi:MAG: DUF1800 domain-containing protein [Pseudomonadota bacterium]
MLTNLVKTSLFTGVGTLALVAGSHATLANQPAAQETSPEGGSLSFIETLERAERASQAQAQSSTEQSGAFEPVAPANTIFRALTVPTGGLYSFQALKGSAVKIYVDGVLAIDATGVSIGDASEPIKAIQTLAAGEHAISIETNDLDAADLQSVLFSAVGAEPQSLIDVTSDISFAEANEILGSQPGILTAGANPGAVSTSDSGNLLGLPGNGGDGAFTIGGTSSPATRNGQRNPRSADGATDGEGGSSSGSVQTAGLAPMSSDTSSGTTTTSSGGVSFLPSSSSGSGSGSGSGPGSTDAPNQIGGNSGLPGTPSGVAPGAAPGAPPVVTPTPVDPSTTPTPETVQTSPLSPPTNVEITEAVQLTSAGNINGEIPSTGGTLFGTVMNPSMFDIVNVSVGANARTATVDVGPMTGQFAVRIFEDDFAAGNEIQVTLTGASTASDEVEATPVAYAITGMPVQDGVGQALSRLTFGATPELYSRVRAIGFQAYVEEQLNPDAINDAAFNALNPTAIIDPTEQNGNTLLRKLVHYDLAHAGFSEKQLQEIMAHFWANHFHAVTKDTSMFVQNLYDRQFFRENAFGTFRELLLYSARSPLMSQYLDNDENRFNTNRENDGINENYGREILELSTVGVEAGYTPADVDMVSRVFSGWRYERTNPDADGVAQEFEFVFFPNDHDPQDKLIPFLNTTITGRSGDEGVQEGEELIEILANHPSTQARTCRKLVQLLVADTPPDGFVTACVDAWGIDGDIDAMLRAILLNPAYINTAAYQRNKAKTPFEYSVSVMRAFGARPDNPTEDNFWNNFREAHELAGHNFVRFPVPTGLPEVSAAWLNSASMVASYNEVTAIAEQRQNYGIDLVADIADAGIESAEEVATYLLTIATTDRFSMAEFDDLVAVLKGDDGIFEPRVEDETRALERAMGLIVVTPSFQLQ